MHTSSVIIPLDMFYYLISLGTYIYINAYYLHIISIQSTRVKFIQSYVKMRSVRRE